MVRQIQITHVVANRLMGYTDVLSLEDLRVLWDLIVRLHTCNALDLQRLQAGHDDDTYVRTAEAWTVLYKFGADRRLVLSMVVNSDVQLQGVVERRIDTYNTVYIDKVFSVGLLRFRYVSQHAQAYKILIDAMHHPLPWDGSSEDAFLYENPLRPTITHHEDIIVPYMIDTRHILLVGVH